MARQALHAMLAACVLFWACGAVSAADRGATLRSSTSSATSSTQTATTASACTDALARRRDQSVWLGACTPCESVVVGGRCAFDSAAAERTRAFRLAEHAQQRLQRTQVAALRHTGDHREHAREGAPAPSNPLKHTQKHAGKNVSPACSNCACASCAPRERPRLPYHVTWSDAAHRELPTIFTCPEYPSHASLRRRPQRHSTT